MGVGMRLHAYARPVLAAAMCAVRTADAVKECEIPDIWTEREVDPECFTDGVGVITSAGMARAMRMHWETHDRPARMKRVPSAIQIRFGGAKGMLCLWDGQCASSQTGSFLVCVTVAVACAPRRCCMQQRAAHRALRRRCGHVPRTASVLERKRKKTKLQ